MQLLFFGSFGRGFSPPFFFFTTSRPCPVTEGGRAQPRALAEVKHGVARYDPAHGSDMPPKYIKLTRHRD